MDKKCLNYRDFDYNNEKLYTIKDLKYIFKCYNYKPIYKKKSELYNECCVFLKKTHCAKIIQRCWRKYFIYIYNTITGPAIIKRSICNNIEEFLTLDSVNKINYYDFISFKDNDGFIYGFSMNSLKMIIKDNKLKNPYNRNIIPNNIVDLIKKKQTFNKIMKVNKIRIENNKSDFISLFQKMDELGNITMVEWLTDLTPSLLRIFIIELHEIWNYRAGLTKQDKINLCPPHGNPFINTPMNQMIQKNYNQSSTILYQYIHNIFCLLLDNPGTDNESKKICSFHILITLTLVSEEAANSLPWLYNSAII